MHTIKYCVGCLLAVSLLSSCKKDDAYDVAGDPEVKFFFNNNPTAGNRPPNSVGFDVVNFPDVAGTGLVNLSNTLPATIKLPVFATKAIGQDVVISAVLDTALVAKYNVANNTDYAVLPAGILNTSGLSARILKGTSTSADSIAITTNAAGVNLLTRKSYLAPVKITTVSDPAVGKITATAASQVAYIVVNTELRRIKYLAVAADAQGALLTGRTAWGVNFNPAPAPTTAGSVVDGSNTTYSRWTASPVTVDVNLQSAKNVTGLRLYTATSTTYTPTQVEVSVSNDGVTYDVLGAPLKANLTYASSYNYILFYKAIQATYIRLKLSYSTSTNTQNFRLCELDVYAN
jgi:hypothetical protein